MDDNIVQILSIVVAAGSAIASFIFSVRASRDTKKQYQMQLIGLIRDYYSDLQRWADSVIEVSSEAIFLCDLDPKRMQEGEFFTKWLGVKQRLSSLLDQGQFFLPNEYESAYGQHKHPAFRGFRRPELECLAEMYEVLRQFDQNSQQHNRSLRSQLWDIRKQFVSQLQQTLDPRQRERELQKLAKEAPSLK